MEVVRRERAAGVASVRVVAFSDSHLTREADDDVAGPDRRLVAAIDAVVAQHPRIDLVLLPGDIADDGSSSAYDRVRHHLSRIDAPVVAVGGNHDLVDAVADAFGPLGETDLGVWRVVTVDSVIPGEVPGRVAVDDLRMALGDDTGRPTMLVMHHPPASISTHPWFTFEGAAEVVAEIGRRSDVRVVVSGHLHQRFHVGIGDVTYVGCPSTWYAIAHHGDEMTFRVGSPGAVVFDLGDDGHVSWNWVDSVLE